MHAFSLKEMQTFWSPSLTYGVKTMNQHRIEADPARLERTMFMGVLSEPSALAAVAAVAAVAAIRNKMV